MATKKIEEEEEILSSLAVEQYWTDKWDNSNQIEKATLMHNYISKKYNLNSFGIYVYAMGNAECFNKEDVTVSAGTYNAYAITVTRGLKYYYAPEVGNIIKFSFLITNPF